MGRSSFTILFGFYLLGITVWIPTITSTAEQQLPSLRHGLLDIASSTGDLLQGAMDNSAQLLFNATRATGEVAENAASWGLNFKLRRSMEKFRSRMRYGIPELHVPVLEPFHLDEFYVSTDNPEIGDIDFHFSDLTIYGLSTFTIDRTKLSVITPTISFNITIPKLFITGNYNVSGVLAQRFTLFGGGPCEITFQNLRIYVNVIFGFSRGLYVKTFDLDFYVKSVLYDFQNLMGDDEIGRTMNQVFQQLTPEIMEIVKPDILPELKDYLGTTINDTIHDLTLADLFHVVLGEAISL